MSSLLVTAIPVSVNRACRDRDRDHDPDDHSPGHIQPIARSRPAGYTRGIRDNAGASSSRVPAVRVNTPAAADWIAARSASAVHTRPVAAARSPDELAHRHPVPLAPKEGRGYPNPQRD